MVKTAAIAGFKLLNGVGFTFGTLKLVRKYQQAFKDHRYDDWTVRKTDEAVKVG